MSHQYHASSHQSASASSDNQTDLRQYFMGGSHNQGITERGSLQESWTNGNTKPELVSRKAISSLPPSECFLRTLIKEEFGAKEEYEHLWREQHIPCKRLSADFARKAFKAQNVGGTKILNSSVVFFFIWRRVAAATRPLGSQGRGRCAAPGVAGSRPLRAPWGRRVAAAARPLGSQGRRILRLTPGPHDFSTYSDISHSIKR